MQKRALLQEISSNDGRNIYANLGAAIKYTGPIPGDEPRFVLVETALMALSAQQDDQTF